MKPEKKSRKPAEVLGYAAPLTDAEIATLRKICDQDLFVARVAEIAGRRRALVKRAEGLPSHGEVVNRLRAIAGKTRALQGCSGELVEQLGALDERTGAALRWGLRTNGGAGDVLHIIAAILEPSATWAMLLRAIEAANAARAHLRKGRAPLAELRFAGDEVRALFRRHRIKWAVSVKRDNSSDSAAVRVFRICTGCGPGRVERHLPKK